MASELDFPLLVEYGCELCASFAYAPERETGLAGRNALTTPERLEAFALEAKRHRGRQAALSSIPHIIPNAESPLEIIVALLLCLPRRSGGYGLPRPTLNEQLSVTGRMAKTSPSRSMRTDMRWENGVVLEVNSRTHHTGTSAWVHDSIRSNALTYKANRLYTATTPQIVDQREFEQIADLIAGSLGIRPPVESPDRIRRRATLRDQLVDFSRLHPPDALCETIEKNGYPPSEATGADGGCRIG